MSFFDRAKEQFGRGIRKRFPRIVEINEKYKTPRIKMTPFVSIALVFLRLYLLFLVGLLFFKFWTLVKI